MLNLLNRKARVASLLLLTSLGLSACAAPNFDAASPEANTSPNSVSVAPENTFSTTRVAAEVPSDAIYAQVAALISQEWEATTEIAIDLNAVASGIVNITEPGTYRLSGTMADGQITVDVSGDEPVRLILDNAHVTSSTGSPLAILDADGGTALVLAAGSHNSLTDAAVYADTSDDAPNATLFADDDLVIFGTGTLDLTANFNDGINFNDGLVIDQATLNIAAVDDGISGNDFLAVLGGNLTVTESEEGLEAAQVIIAGGNVAITSTDDGVNASSDDEVELGILISGGTLTITADGDGLDSNGWLRQTGGSVIVHGPTGSNESSLDADLGVTLDGGTMFAVGSAGMLVTPLAASAQSWLVTPINSTVPAGATLAILDAAGNEIATLTTTRSVAAVTYSGPALVAGSTYTVTANGTEVASVTAGQAAAGGRGPGGRVPGAGFAPGGQDSSPNQMPDGSGRPGGRPRR